MVRLFVVMYPSETFHSLNTSSGVYFSWTHISAHTSPGACSSVLPGPFRIVLSRTSTSKQQQCKWDLHLVSRSQIFFTPHRSPKPKTVTIFAVPEPANWFQNSESTPSILTTWGCSGSSQQSGASSARNHPPRPDTRSLSCPTFGWFRRTFGLGPTNGHGCSECVVGDAGGGSTPGLWDLASVECPTREFATLYPVRFGPR